MAEKDRMRKKKIQVWLAEEEYIGLKKRAETCGLNLSNYVRKAIFDCYIIRYEPFDIKALTNELNHIGININQIAWRTNVREGDCTKEDVEQLREVVQDMIDIIYSKLWGIS